MSEQWSLVPASQVAQRQRDARRHFEWLWRESDDLPGEVPSEWCDAWWPLTVKESDRAA